eukprot:3907368-Rhodomonas_salina.2
MGEADEAHCHIQIVPMHGHTCRGHGIPAYSESTGASCTCPVSTAPPTRPHCRTQSVCDGDHGVGPGRAVPLGGEQSPAPRGTRFETRIHPPASGSGRC